MKQKDVKASNAISLEETLDVLFVQATHGFQVRAIYSRLKRQTDRLLLLCNRSSLRTRQTTGVACQEAESDLGVKRTLFSVKLVHPFVEAPCCEFGSFELLQGHRVFFD